MPDQELDGAVPPLTPAALPDAFFTPTILEHPAGLAAQRVTLIADLAERMAPPPNLMANATRIDHVRLGGDVQFIIADPDTMPLAILPWTQIEERATKADTLPVLWLGENLGDLIPSELDRPTLPARPLPTDSPIGLSFFERLQEDEQILDIRRSRISEGAKLEKIRVRTDEVANALRLRPGSEFRIGDSVKTRDGVVSLTQVLPPPIQKINVDPLQIQTHDLPQEDLLMANQAFNLATRLAVLAESFDVLYVAFGNFNTWEFWTQKMDPIKALKAAISQSPERARLLTLADRLVLGTGGWVLQRLYQLGLPASDPLAVSLGVREFHTGRLPTALDAKSLTASRKAVKSGQSGIRDMLSAAKEDLNAISKADKYMKDLMEFWERKER